MKKQDGVKIKLTLDKVRRLTGDELRVVTGGLQYDPIKKKEIIG